MRLLYQGIFGSATEQNAEHMTTIFGDYGLAPVEQSDLAGQVTPLA